MDALSMTTDAAVGFRLSRQQERFWRLSSAAEGSPYHVCGAFRVLGDLDPARLKRALQDVVNRHEILRTTFHQQPDRFIPEQRVGQSGIDWEEAETPAERQADFEIPQDWLEQDFDLEDGPMLRARLVSQAGSQSDRGHLFLLALCGLCGDGRTLDNIVREMVSVYAGEALTRDDENPPLQYIDFSEWHRELQDSPEAQEAHDAWRRHRARFETDQPKLGHTAGDPTFRPRRETVALPAETGPVVASLCRVHGTHPSSFYLAAWQSLIHRLTGQSRLLLGWHCAGRTYEDLESAIGLFASDLPLISEGAPDHPFRSLMKQDQTTIQRAEEAQEYFDWQVLESGSDETPFFSCGFDFRARPATIEAAGIVVETLPASVVLERFQLRLTIDGCPERPVMILEYDANLWPGGVSWMAEPLVALIGKALAEPETTLGELPFLSDQHRRQILADAPRPQDHIATSRPVPLTTADRQQLLEWNDTAVDYDDEAPLHRRFEAQVDRAPSAVAVRFEGARLNYAELDAASCRLARHLLAAGVRPDDTVAVLMERSLDLIIALLAVLKAGAAYVPLDPTYPTERLALVLDDLGDSRVALTDPVAMRPDLALAARWIDVRAERQTIAARSTSRPRVAAGLDHAAYVIYTSGSTGRPKGVVVTHRAISNRLSWMQQTFGLAPDDKILQKTPFGFDVSVWEFFWPLLNGAELVVAKPEGHKDPAYLAQIVREEQITTLHFVPTMLKAFVAQPEASDLSSLRRVMASGEALPADLVTRFYQECGRHGARLHNLYGPTEAAVDVTWWACPPGRATQVPIGRPIANTTLAVMDADLQPVPIGVAGELCLGGVQLARGYFRRPSLTARAFVPDSSTEGGRLYKTGDRVRWLKTGEVEYLGRLDFQVKLRGFRIELGDVESALSALPRVRETVVVLREERLVAYVVADDELPDLRQELTRSLPDFMIPTAVVRLDRLPTTPNGKLDVGALPAPDTEKTARRAAYVAPRDHRERVLVEIWRHVLGLERIGVHDNFFSLGGDSILGLQVTSRANRAGFQLLPRQLFEHQTIALLAKAEIVQTEAFEPVTGPAPLTPIQHWFFEQDFADPHHWNQALLLEPAERLDPAWLEGALALLSRRHDALNLRFLRDEEQSPDGGWRQRVGESTPRPALLLVDISELAAGDRVTALDSAAALLQGNLSLEAGRLSSAALFQSGAPDQDRLLLIVHHLAIDAVSWHVLLHDLELAYCSFENDTPIDLGPPPVSFLRWATRLSEALRTNEQPDLGYWTRLTYAPRAEWPGHEVSNLDGSNRVGNSETVSLEVDPGITAALVDEVGQAYRTDLVDALLCALLRSFQGAFGISDLVIDLEDHGRDAFHHDFDLSHTVGWFTALYPMRLQIDAADAIGESLQGIKEQGRAVPRPTASYGLLRYLHPDPAIRSRLAALDNAPILFNFLGHLDPWRDERADSRPGDRRLFRKLAREPHGLLRSPRAHRSHRLEVNGWITEGRLVFEIRFSPNRDPRESIEHLAQSWDAELRKIVAHCQRPDAGGVTPSDFPLAGLTASTLAALPEGGRHLDDLYPLSPVQQGMFFHHLLEPEAEIYIQQLSCVLQGDVDEGAFRESWRRVIERHAVLRTTVLWRDVPHPLAAVLRHVDLAFEPLDWTDVDDEEERLERFLVADRERGFDLANGPLMRFTWIAVPGRKRFVWSFHHLVLDGWSTAIVLQDFLACYESLNLGEPPRLSHAPPLYRDFVAWQKQQDEAEDEAFWRGYLRGFRTPIKLGRERDGRGPRTTARLDTFLGGAAFDRLGSWAREQRLTLNTLLQGAWALLLGRRAGVRDVVFGVTSAGRTAQLEEAERRVGLYINTLPLRVDLKGDAEPVDWLRDLQNRSFDLRDHETTPLVKIRQCSEIPTGRQLFDSLLVFENYPVDEVLTGASGPLQFSDVRNVQQTNYPLTLVAVPGDRLKLSLSYDVAAFDRSDLQRLLGQLLFLLDRWPELAGRSLAQMSPLAAAEFHQLTIEWNETERIEITALAEGGIYGLFAAQALKTPQARAVHGDDGELTYAELKARADRLARHLRSRGIRPESRVGLFTERSTALPVSLLGILAAGGAYVPLDPSHPDERLARILADAEPDLVVTQKTLLDRLASDVEVLLVDDALEDACSEGDMDLNPSYIGEHQAAHVIYTSGSTGQPKGVVTSHGNLASFLAAVDRRIDVQESTTWLATTSVAFDMAVLELLWPLTRGHRVVLYDRGWTVPRPTVTSTPLAPEVKVRTPESQTTAEPRERNLQLSLFFFVSDGKAQGGDKYRLLLDGARVADRRGFQAIWVPERHFHPFGGLFPNPSVVASALSQVTERLRLRAGSVVLPLHHPLRVAEEWSVVDNLSGGRVDLAFASGWHPDDFVLSPGRYDERKADMFRHIETVRRLWRGESVQLAGGTGKEVEVQIFPRPIQNELPFWLSSSGNPETFRMAGQLGANLLTHLFGQKDLDDLAGKIRLYRQAWREHGHPGSGHVSMMLHTFLDRDMASARSKVRGPLAAYLKSSLSLSKRLAAHLGENVDIEHFTPQDMEALLDRASDRFMEQVGLFGSQGDALPMLERLSQAGIDEIGCLVDFGVDFASVMQGLELLGDLLPLRFRAPASDDSLRDEANGLPSNEVDSLGFGSESLGSESLVPESPAAAILQHGVTHLKTTPSFVRLLATDPAAGAALGQLRQLILGGEALPAELASQLNERVSRLDHTYGPTETTSFSTFGRIDPGVGRISIGRPIDGTEIYLFDRDARPVPLGSRGEIHIGGAGLARGYLGQGGLTAERFVPHPFKRGQRLYRTGDLARHGDDGRIEFLGRRDDQIKVRGHRVEPREVERVLEAHPGVRQAMVGLQGEADDQRLVACFLAIEEPAPTARQLREFLAERLPPAMVPSHLLAIESLPLTANGKLDRARLPRPPVTESGAGSPGNTATDLERQLANIWRSILRVENVGANESFFELGGHSLLVVQLHNAVRDELGEELPLVEFFQYPTVRTLAARLSGGRGAANQSSPNQASPDQTSPDQTSLDQTSLDQTSLDQNTPDQISTDQISTGQKRAEQRRQSMRQRPNRRRPNPRNQSRKGSS